MTWKPDERYRHNFGSFTVFSVVSEQHREYGTGHRVTFPDGRQLRVLPTDADSGQKRSQLIQGALKALSEVVGVPEGFDPVAYLIGVLHVGLTEPKYEPVLTDCPHDTLSTVSEAKRMPTGVHRVSVTCTRCGHHWHGVDLDLEVVA